MQSEPRSTTATAASPGEVRRHEAQPGEGLGRLEPAGRPPGVVELVRRIHGPVPGQQAGTGVPGRQVHTVGCVVAGVIVERALIAEHGDRQIVSVVVQRDDPHALRVDVAQAESPAGRRRRSRKGEHGRERRRLSIAVDRYGCAIAAPYRAPKGLLAFSGRAAPALRVTVPPVAGAVIARVAVGNPLAERSSVRYERQWASRSSSCRSRCSPQRRPRARSARTEPTTRGPRPAAASSGVS